MAVQTSNQSPQSPPLSAEVIGNAFVEQYYLIIHRSPELAHNFYQDSSVLGRPGPNGIMTSVTTMKGISDNIMAFDYKDCKTEIINAYAQESLMGGLIIGVTGCLTGKDKVMRSFTQTFFLAQQDKGFYVLNDFLQFLDVPKPGIPLPVHDADEDAPTACLTEDPEVALLPDHHMQTQTSTPGEKVRDNGSTVSAESDIKGSSVEEVAVSKPQANPSQNDVVQVTKLAPNIQEDAEKKSYASILAKESTVNSAVHVPATVIVRVTPNSDKQPSAFAASKQPRASAAPKQLSASAAPKQASASEAPKQPSALEAHKQPSASEAPKQPSASEAPKASVPPSNGATQNSTSQTEAKGIYIRGLPTNISHQKLVDVVKKFGPVKRDNGVQIRRYEDGFCCGFVEFESSSSARQAFEAKAITFGDKEAYIQYKKSVPQDETANNRGGRFSSGRGGFRRENFRGQGSFGEGRSNGRSENGYHHRSGDFSGQTRGSGRDREASQSVVYQNGGGRGTRQGGTK